MDTACSSSLVALRQACLHLTGGGGSVGEKGTPPRVALVGGVNLLLSPGPFDLFSKVRYYFFLPLLIFPAGLRIHTKVSYVRKRSPFAWYDTMNDYGAVKSTV